MPAYQEELTDLAAAGAKSLVASIGTDLWPTVRGLVHKVLIRRTRRRTELAEALDHLAAATVDPESAATCSEAVRFWTEALAEIVSQDPALRPALTTLAGLTLPRPAPAVSTSASQTNTARGSGHVYANQHGSQHIYIHHDDSDDSEPQTP